MPRNSFLSWGRRVAVFCGTGLCLSAIVTPTAIAGRQQIFAQGNHGTSNRLGAEGDSAYIVSSQGQNRGILLSKVNQNGFAYNAGLTEGDVLLNINGHVTPSFSDADRVLG